jgi:hypothetical protein
VTVEPTAWFLYNFTPPVGSDLPARVSAAARSYWPTSTRCETNDGSGWVERPILLALAEDPSWESVSEAEVDTWLLAG